MVITRSAFRRACDSGGSSDASEGNFIPPWCSSGKAHERRKPRKVLIPLRKLSESPQRENIFEFLHEDECRKFKRRRSCKVKHAEKWKYKRIFLLIFLVFTGLAVLWKPRSIPTLPRAQLLAETLAKTAVSLFGTVEYSTAVSEECCHQMRYLAAELLRAEQALRNSMRLRRTMLLASHPRTAIPNTESKYIPNIRAFKGQDTTEWGGRVALWGVVPLWRAAPPPHTVLAVRLPTPADCWPISGSQGEIIFELPEKCQVERMSIEHVRPDTAKSAPKNFILHGILENGTWTKEVEGEYYYRGPAKQYFLLQHKIHLKQVVLKLLSNHGNPQYTCVYRVHFYSRNVKVSCIKIFQD